MNISYRVLKMDEFNDSVFYSLQCACGEESHNMILSLEHEKDEDLISLFLYKKLYWRDYYKNWLWYEKFWSRVSTSFKLLFGGYIEMQGDFLIQGKEHINSFILALEEGIEKIGGQK